MSSRAKKVTALVKALEEQIKFEIGYSNSHIMFQNQFRILDNRSFEKENSKNMILYKTFLDKSLNKEYELFVKSDLSDMLKYNYSVDNKGIEEKLENLINRNRFSTSDYELSQDFDQSSSYKESKNNGNSTNDIQNLKLEGTSELTIEQYDTFYTKLIKTDMVIRNKMNKEHALFIETMIDFDEKLLYIERILPFVDKEAVNDNSVIVAPKSLIIKKSKTQTNLIKGPLFAYMDPSIQEAMYQLLKNWGIIENKQFIIDIFTSAETREQSLYLDWLFRLKDHLTKTSK
ncbi:uncharacterized protein HGUI_00244 [Hanseniaspora guilliermondii]|uniref:Uncharacterized protein n=1 Tax=Hanseniaspora guilliermondii TaxID=56406 RepID=A0A1L0AWP7_9ASCO|nr:uncharacterized protein HGUI_00244 [Hanseniaspora guilliermondii]